MKLVTKTLSLVIVMSFSGPVFAYAQIAPANTPVGQIEVTKVVTASNTVVTNTENPVLAGVEDGVELTPEEKRVRAKDGLGKALILALEKVQKLTADIENMEFTEDSTEYALQQQFLGQLDSYRIFYTEKLDALSALETLEDIQTLAKEIKSYRDDTYTPGVENIVEFILVFYNEDVINIANERLSKISADLDKLVNVGLLEEKPFEGKITEIKTLLTEAAQLQNQARDIIIILPEDETPEDITITVDAEVDSTSTIDMESDTLKETIPTTKELLETSLGNVKAVYADFLEISNSVKETLGV